MARSNLTTKDIAEKVIAATKPRYTVELTTEGWQIKDNVGGRVLADSFGDEVNALELAEAMNRNDATEKKERRQMDRSDALGILLAACVIFVLVHWI